MSESTRDGASCAGCVDDEIMPPRLGRLPHDRTNPRCKGFEPSPGRTDEAPKPEQLRFSCEKCWSDSRISGNYQALMKEREASPCTPEESAGPGAAHCPRCKRKTLHQHVEACVRIACGWPDPVAKEPDSRSESPDRLIHCHHLLEQAYAVIDPVQNEALSEAIGKELHSCDEGKGPCPPNSRSESSTELHRQALEKITDTLDRLVDQVALLAGRVKALETLDD